MSNSNLKQNRNKPRYDSAIAQNHKSVPWIGDAGASGERIAAGGGVQSRAVRQRRGNPAVREIARSRVSATLYQSVHAIPILATCKPKV